MLQLRMPALAAALSALALAVAAAGPAAAVPRASGPFKIGASSSPGSVVLESDGTRVAVFDIASGLGKTKVCVIAATGRKCQRSVLLSPVASDNTFGTPGVFLPAKNHVVVLQHTCCDANPNSTLLYTSTNGGRTFGAPVRVGALGVDHSELIGKQILFTEQNSAAGLQVVSVPVGAKGASPTATISAKEVFDTGLGTYRGGALIGSDFFAKTYTTHVYAAKPGANFDLASSYHLIGTFGGESLIAMSGAALLTDRAKDDKVLLRMFNGTKFGAPHVVAHIHGGLGTWITVFQDRSGHVHVFAILGSASYEMFEVSTSNGGASWTKAARLGNGIHSVWLSAAVSAKNRGLVLGNTPAWGYPVP